jgi:hypothetical protein
MDILSQEELRYLFEQRHRFCVSLFLTTPREGKEVSAGRIQLKDLLRDAEERLSGAGLRGTEAKALLAPAQQLERRSEFWRYESDGLAIFLAHGFFRYFRLPLKPPAFAAVEEHFEITPLLPLWTSEDYFYLLALSRNRVKLFQGTRYALSEVDVKGVPLNLHETLGHSVDESLREQHTLKAGLPEDELRYFRQINESLRHSCKDQRVPLVLAGVEKSASLYRQVNTYKGLLDGCVPGNPDRLSTADLHVKAREIARSHYDGMRKQAIGQYTERTDSSKTSHKLEEILPAAYQGRVYHLFVATGREQWGKFDEETSELSLHERAEKGDRELLNLAVIGTILNRGGVYALAPGDVPDGASLAAVLRY